MVRNLWLVINHDVRMVLQQWSFWLFSFIMPVILLFYFTYDAIQDSAPMEAVTSTGASTQSPPTLPKLGLVDEAKAIIRMPLGFPADLFTRYPNEAAAQSALEAGQISQYIHISTDYVSTGAVTVVTQNFRLLGSGEATGVAYGSNEAWVLEYLLNYNLIRNDGLLMALRNPTPGQLVEHHVLNPSTADAQNQPLMADIFRVVPFIFYFLLVLSGSYLLRSVVAEKENRTAEVLLLSLPPRDLMLGKILATSVVLTLQLLIWLGAAGLVFARNVANLQTTLLVLPAEFWLWAGLFLIFGYLLFSAVMAAAGALAPNAREGGQIIWALILPLMPTLMFASEFVEQPDSPLVLFLSLFPFSAPSAMVTRLAVGQVPVWQLSVSLAGLALTAWLFIYWAGRFFRADVLLSFAAFNWRRLVTDWRFSATP